MRLLCLLLSLALMTLTVSGCSDNNIEAGEMLDSIEEEEPGRLEQEEPDSETTPACLKSLYYDHLQPILMNERCTQASSSQVALVNEGNLKKEKFLSQCYQQTNHSCWCDQLIRPNPDSIATFQCTYGADQIHQFIHPDEDTWKYAIEAVKIVEEFEAQQLNTRIIYNWWRPEPYNKNVGGASGRHPFGTSIDVRFETKQMQEKAFQKLCKMRKQGRLRAIGYYASTAIHLGIGDHTANTWGKSCP